MFKYSRLHPYLLAPLAAIALAGCASDATTGPDAALASLDRPVTEISECGTVLRTPGRYVVTQDLLNCPGNGIEIAANWVTLRLAGHTISGTGVGTSFGYGISVGPALFDGVAHARVLGPGTVAHFRYGIVTEHMAYSTIRGVTVQFNEQGLTFNRRFSGDGLPSSHDSILDNTFQDNLYHGVTVNGGQSSLFRGNLSTRNGSGMYSGFGFYLYDAQKLTLRRNTVVDNHQVGIVIENGSLGNLIAVNTILRNTYADRLDQNCTGNTWRENRYERAFWPYGCEPVP